MSFIESVLLAGLLGCCSGARAGDPQDSPCRPSILPVQHAVEVKQVNGTVQYAYEGTGWRTLSVGKQLQAGATVRTTAGSAAVLRVKEHSSTVKVSPATTLHICSVKEAPRFTKVALAAQP